MYETLVPLPEGSRSIEFAFTDGVVYDTNNGAFYHIPLEQTVTEKQLDTPIESASPNTKVSELDPLKASLLKFISPSQAEWSFRFQRVLHGIL